MSEVDRLAIDSMNSVLARLTNSVISAGISDLMIAKPIVWHTTQFVTIRMWVPWSSHRPWSPTWLSLAPHGWENNCPMTSSGQAWLISLAFSISLPDWRYNVPWGTWDNVSPIGTLGTIVIQDKVHGSNTSSSIVRHHHWRDTSMSHKSFQDSQCHLSWQIINKFQEDNIDNGTGNQLGIGISAAKITTKERSSMIQTGHRNNWGLVDTYFKQWGLLLLTWSSIKLATCKAFTTHLLAQTPITMNQYWPLILTSLTLNESRFHLGRNDEHG